MIEGTTLPSIDSLALSHGQARWTLYYLNLRVGDSDATFDTYLKSLRRDGVPFAPEELGVGTGHNLVYRYEHLMELTVALYLRQQAILSRDIVRLLADDRAILRPMYRQAFQERESGRGRDRVVRFDDGSRQTVSGLYLDLRLRYTEAAQLVGLQPRLLDPVEALKVFGMQHSMTYTRPPLPLSQLTEDVVQLAVAAPVLRRGWSR
jgi:hypothetical protein